MGRESSQLPISYHQRMLLVPGLNYIHSVVAQWSLIDVPKQPRLLTSQENAFHKIKATLLDTTSRQLTEVELLLMWNSPKSPSVIHSGMFSVCSQKRNMNAYPATRHLIYRIVLLAKYAQATMAQTYRSNH